MTTPSNDCDVTPCHCGLLRQASRHLSNFYDEALAGTGYKITQLLLLSAIDKRGELLPTMGHLAEDLSLDPTTVGRNLRPLQRDGLVEVIPGKEDARRRRIALTAKGRAKLEEARRIWDRIQENFVEAYGPKDIENLRKLLIRVTETELRL